MRTPRQADCQECGEAFEPTENGQTVCGDCCPACGGRIGSCECEFADDDWD